MQRLSKEKRNQLVLIGLLTTMVIVGLYMSLITMQRQSLASIPGQVSDAQRKLERMRKEIREAGTADEELKAANERLAAIEGAMPTGDLNAWFYSTIKEYRKNFSVELPQLSTPEFGEVALLPKFPYKRVRVSMGGSGFYHEIGKFLARFENDFPYFAVQNLMISPEPGNPATPEDREKLTFRMDVIALVRSGAE